LRHEESFQRRLFRSSCGERFVVRIAAKYIAFTLGASNRAAGIVAVARSFPNRYKSYWIEVAQRGNSMTNGSFP
jgi:hypothetical protein